MKKIVPVLLAVLLLTGCATTPAPATETTEVTVATTLATEPTEPPVTLLTGTDGSLSTYTLETGGCAGLFMLGASRAMLTTGGQMYLLTGDELTVANSRRVGGTITASDPSIVVMDDQLSFYDGERGAYVTVGKNLTEIAARTIQAEITAGPIMSPDFTVIYYCTADGVRAMDMSTGNSRLLRKEHGTILSLDGLLFDGSILRYTRQLSDGESETCFIRTADGTQTYFADLDGELVTWGGSFSAVMRLELPLSGERQILTGSADGSAQRLAVADSWDTLVFPGSGMALLQTVDSGNVKAELYDLTTGKPVAAREFEGRAPFPNGWMDGSQLWLWDSGESAFYRWDTAQDAVEGESLLVPQYTLSAPDTAGMEACAEQAQALGETYGVEIRLTESGNRTTGVDYSGYPDYRPGQYRAALEGLEQTMARFPEGFFGKLDIVIELVDDFDPDLGIRPGTGSLTIGEERLIQVSVCQDLEAIFCHELFHAAELYIQSRTSELGDWEDCNPRGFDYAGSYAAYESGALKESEDLDSFVDDYAMVTAREDRAQTFMYAMLSGQEARFASDDTLDKLELLCEAIREAYDYDDDDETLTLPWEQYLDMD